jgi:hypothetical protein
MSISHDGLLSTLLGKVDLSGDLEIAWQLSRIASHYAFLGVQTLDEGLTIEEHQVPPNKAPTLVAPSNNKVITILTIASCY